MMIYMDNEKAALIQEIKSMMSNKPYRSRGYDSLTTHKIIDKLFMRLGILIIIGLLGFLALRDYFNNRSCKTR